MSKTCEYCDFDSAYDCGRSIACNNDCGTEDTALVLGITNGEPYVFVRIHNTEHMAMDDFPAKFCLMCGRKLAEEA